MPRWPERPSGWTRSGSQNWPKSGLVLGRLKNVNLLKDIAVLSLSILFDTEKNLFSPSTKLGASHGGPLVHALLLVQVPDNLGFFKGQINAKALTSHQSKKALSYLLWELLLAYLLTMSPFCVAHFEVKDLFWWLAKVRTPILSHFRVGMLCSSLIFLSFSPKLKPLQSI